MLHPFYISCCTSINKIWLDRKQASIALLQYGCGTSTTGYHLSFILFTAFLSFLYLLYHKFSKKSSVFRMRILIFCENSAKKHENCLESLTKC
nr:MAG TPA: hypothetical protein [Caudoviricetes sp.]